MKTIATIFFLVATLTAFCQNTIGLPEIINYSKQAYNAGAQNWDIKQGQGGIIYFANNEGLLSFDGTFWKIYTLPNRTIVRAIEISKDQKIYVGGQNEVGFFAPDEKGFLVYHSLLNLIPKKDRSFDDIWNICTYGADVFFRSNKRIFQLSNNKVIVYSTNSEWRFLGVCNKQLIAEDLGSGALLYDKGSWVPFLRNTELAKTSLITSFVPLDNNRSLVATLKDGLFIYNGSSLTRVTSPDVDQLSRKIIYKAITVGPNRIALATSFDGCHIIDEKGNLIQSLTHVEGLQNNSLRSIFSDKDNNLWLGLDNGIDFITYNNSIKHIYPETQNIGSGYSTLLFQNQLYLGTSNGLYKVTIDNSQNFSFIKSKLEPVKNTEGEVRNLSIVNNQLLLGHHNGAFVVHGTMAIPLDNSSGYWTFMPMSNVLPSSMMVAGNYLGLSFFDFSNGQFYKNKTNAQFESARFVVVENERSVWVAHPYKGIYHITLNADKTTSIKLYDHNKGLWSANNNYIFKIKNRIVATTEKGLYEYNDQKDAFEFSAYFKNILNVNNIRYLKEDPSGNIWFVREKELGVVDVSGPKPKTIFFSELNNKLVSGFENIYPFDDHNIIIGGEKGFYHVDFENYRRNKNNLQTQIRLAKSFGKVDSILYGGYLSEAKGRMHYNMNSLHFEYSAILYGQQSNIEYSYFLKGFDKAWSKWSGKPEKEYTNLPAGDYIFQVKARNNLGNESAVGTYSFTILPPWYQTTIAYLVYALIFAALIYFLYRWQRKKFLIQKEQYEEEQKQLQYLHQLELEKNEKEIVKLKNEKLEAEIGHKNSELATSAMHLVQKREMLEKIRENMNGLLKKIDNEQVANEFKKLLKVLVEDNKVDDTWEHFAHHFDKVHTDFLVLLKNKYPSLTASELKLCAYLRMNLSSKEIAQLLNISVRGVEISRYRLRKKLELPKEANLFEFLLNEQAENKTDVNQVMI
ncbi:MAG TPA: triple tyrosine motif-containing protein [Flavisolibacter sp.]|jgi:ligand-binding sensor domain-containing protein/DNA-binding CsgD family transcriptional regulator|nr:triple tyrosine motif-containing protein [Flavisolibacter sp.]